MTTTPQKVTLITGAAHGIGKGMASALANAGLKIIVTDIQESAGKALVASIQADGGDAFFIKADLRHEDEIKALIEQSVAHFDRLDIVVNNARPRLRILPFHESLAEWDLAMDILLKAPALISRYAYPHLLKAGGGNIINIGSTNAFYISHQPAAYHVAKAGLLHLTRYLAREFSSQGIRVNTVCPGLVDIHDEGKPLSGNPLNKSVTEIAVPLKRAARVEEIAEAVLFLCSASSNYITGQVLVLDGGMTLNDHFHIAREAFTFEPSVSSNL